MPVDNIRLLDWFYSPISGQNLLTNPLSAGFLSQRRRRLNCVTEERITSFRKSRKMDDDGEEFAGESIATVGFFELHR